MSQVRSAPRVCVVGFRKGLADALDRRGIPFAVWNDRPLKRRKPTLHTLVAPFGFDNARIRKTLAPIAALGPFSHVIAGSEAGVYAASVARRALGARRSRDTVILRCRDKLLMKQHLRKLGIPMTDFLPATPDLDGESVLAKLGSPVVVKARRESGGRGISIVHSPEELRARARRDAIIERFVDASEVSVESFVNHGEILFTNVTEYVVHGRVNVVPGKLPAAVRSAVLELNRRSIEGLGIAWGITHLEVYLTPEGPLFGEVALRPPGGYIMELIPLAWGFDPWRALVAVELDEPMAFPASPRRAAAATVLHPGPGIVDAVVGLEEARAHPSVSRLRVKVRPGDTVTARAGIGEDVGYVLQVADDRSALLEAVRWLSHTLRVEVH